MRSMAQLLPPWPQLSFNLKPTLQLVRLYFGVQVATFAPVRI